MTRTALALLWLLVAAGQSLAQQDVSNAPVPSPDLSSYATTSAVAGAYAAKNGSGQVTSMASGVAPSTIWSTTARQTMNTSSDVSCFSATGQGPGLTIPANGPYAGNQYQLNCYGVYSTPIANTATLLAKIKWGATTVASVTIPAVGQLTTNFPWTAQANCTVITAGASGTMECLGSLCFSTALTGIAPLCSYILTASPVTIDTTVDSKIDMTAQWSTVAGGQTASTIIGTVVIWY